MICVVATIAALLPLVESATVINFVNKQCDQSDTFLQFFGESLQECTEECDKNSRCLSVMYMQRMKHCSLKDKGVANAIDRLGVNGSQCMFLEKNDWISSDDDPCNENKCNVTEICVSTKQGFKGFSCLKSTCPSPPVIANAYLLSDIRTVGSVNRYHCKKDFRSFGTPLIKCISNAEWLSESFWCKRRCSKPKSSYSNAVLSKIEYVGDVMSVQEILHFTCRNDYQALGPTVRSTCSEDGFWNYNLIRCCHNETYSIAWYYLCSFYTGQLKSYAQFGKICSGKGYSRTGFHPSLVKYMRNNHLAHNMLMPQTKSYIEEYYNIYLIECFESGNITMGNLTYDEKIQFARDNDVNMTLAACAQVTWWAPSEPSGGTEENCIMKKTNEAGYLLYDIPCDNLTDLNLGGFCHWTMPSI